MAVDSTANGSAPDGASSHRFLVGTNVMVATAIVVAIVVVAQLIAFRSTTRWDLTSSGINSLSEGSENLLRGLDGNVRLTSLYFEANPEDEDQPRYRRAVRDLLDLYESTNRAKVRSDWVNPLQDHEAYRALTRRLADKAAFKEQIEGYQERITKYQEEIDTKIRALVQSELDQIAAMGSALGGAPRDPAIAQVQNAFQKLIAAVESQREQIDAHMLGDSPLYTQTTAALRTFYTQLSRDLKNISDFASSQARRDPELAGDQAQFLREASHRYAELVALLEAETTALQDLEPLRFDDLVAQLGPTTNPILVETDEDARVVDFSSVWPPVRQGAGGRFDDRAFKGEEKLTSAILRVTHKEQTAVVFVRYGGPSLFVGGFMPQQPPAPYTQMKQQLEDTNFVVEEWDLKSSTTPPVIDPAPTRTIWVLLKPTPPQRGPMGQPGQDPPFSETHKQAVLKAIGDSGRALFIAGWYPGPFGPIASTYEYNEYFKEQWGVEVDTSSLLIETSSIGPGKYGIARGRDPLQLTDLTVGDHDIVSGALTRKLGLPRCAPLKIDPQPPDDVTLTKLVYQPRRDGVWGETNVQELQQTSQSRGYLAPQSEDPLGPFDLAVAGTKGDAKMVVVSSATFATDNVAFARTLELSAHGLSLRSLNPGNVSLLINSLHWLNDNTEFMNIGKPIDAAVLEVSSPSTVTAVRAVTIAVWPALALIGGGMVWWVRRR